jgi:pullulanase/glycogen debranching enzyme
MIRPGPIEAWPGQALPLGAHFDGAGTHFSLFSEAAESVVCACSTTTASSRRSHSRRWMPYFDWASDRAPATPLHESIIYEVHVKGLTARHPGMPETVPTTARSRMTPRLRQSPTLVPAGAPGAPPAALVPGTGHLRHLDGDA